MNEIFLINGILIILQSTGQIVTLIHWSNE